MIDTEALRKKVIDLAIQGKLTQQLPEDGNAEDLYIQIQKEKAKLVKEGKIKKEKTLPEISDDEIPFCIPDNWKWVYLGEVFYHNTGKALNASDHSGNKLEYITTSNMYWDHFELDNLKCMYFTEAELDKCTIKKGDLLVCEGGDIGRSAIWPYDYEMRIQNHIHRLRSYFNLDQKFYYYVLRDYKYFGLIDGRGIGLQGFSSKRVHSLVVPLPPVEEQKRIVDVIDTAFVQIDVIDDLQQQYEADREILKGKIIDAGIRGNLTEQLSEDGNAEDLYAQIQEEKARLVKEGKIKKEKPLPEISDDEIPFEIPSNWKWVRFGEIMWNRDSERVPISLSDRKKQSKLYDYYGASGAIDKVDSYLFDKRLLLIGEDGANLLSRSTPIAFIAEGQYWVNNHAHVLDCYIEDYLDFVKYYINSISLVPFVTGMAQPKLNQENMNRIPVPLTPLAEQRRIVERIKELLKILA